VKFFEDNPCMLSNHRRHDGLTEPLWAKLAHMLNSVPQGAVKNVEDWKQQLADKQEVSDPIQDSVSTIIKVSFTDRCACQECQSYHPSQILHGAGAERGD